MTTWREGEGKREDPKMAREKQVGNRSKKVREARERGGGKHPLL